MQLIFIVFCLPQTREKRAAATAPPREMVTLSLSLAGWISNMSALRKVGVVSACVLW